MPRLGVNVDHVATLRQQRRGVLPSPLWAAMEAQRAGCDAVVCHLREDRRHIQDEDLWELSKGFRIKFNLEMSAHPEIVRVACRVRPDQVTLVPERRRELTTEGGLDLRRNRTKIQEALRRFRSIRIRIALFIDPDPVQIRWASQLGVQIVELHTGRYALVQTKPQMQREMRRLKESVECARSLGLIVAAGHGLTYENVKPVAGIHGISELNIGFSIVARAIETGFYKAVREMVKLIHGVRS